jgi:hypothetical protein
VSIEAWIAVSGRTALERLRDEAPDKVISPEGAAYDAERAAWNLHVDHRPKLIVTATSPEDVAAAAAKAGGTAFRAGSHDQVDVMGLRALARPMMST